MKDIFCPNCKGKLNIENNIVFSTRTHDGRVGLVFLSNEPGDYTVKTHPGFNFKEGELVDFYCPICHVYLADKDVNENLVKVHRVDEEGRVFEVLFSGIAGEHSTYIIKDHDVEVFGEDAPKYTEFFGDNFHF